MYTVPSLCGLMFHDCENNSSGYSTTSPPSSLFRITSRGPKWKHQLTEETGRRYCESTPQGIFPFASTTNELTSKGRKRALCTSRDRDWKREGGYFMTTGGLPGHLTGAAHCVHPALVISRAPTLSAGKFISATHGGPTNYTFSVSHEWLENIKLTIVSISLSFSQYSIYFKAARVTAVTFIPSLTYFIWT